MNKSKLISPHGSETLKVLLLEGKEKVQPEEMKDKAKDLLKGLPFKK